MSNTKENSYEDTTLLIPAGYQESSYNTLDSNSSKNTQPKTAGSTFIYFKLNKGTGLGLVMGVYIPCILNIFGVILFLRIGKIVGEVCNVKN